MNKKDKQKRNRIINDRLKLNFKLFLSSEDEREKEKHFLALMPDIEWVQNGVFSFTGASNIEDVRQELYIKLLNVKPEKIDKISNMIGFINAVTTNYLKDLWRKQGSYKKQLGRLEEWAEATGMQWRTNFKYDDKNFPQSDFILAHKPSKRKDYE